MEHFWSIEGVHLQDSWLTIGSFDGVHRGHQKLIKKLVVGAHTANAPAVVLTFYPHPAVTLRGRGDSNYLTSPEERAALLGELGVDVVITHPFNQEVAATSARDFMNTLQAHLNIRQLWVGHDFALGRNRQGDVPSLHRLGEEFGFSLNEIPVFEVEGEVVSSSHIRWLLMEGLVEKANRLLGRPYQIKGKVEIGDGRGHALGFPTANLSTWAGHLQPASGVYVSRATVNGVVWGAVTNVGVRPTFEASSVPTRVETHLLDFNGDLYGEEMELTFLARLRPEQKFSTIEELIAQIQSDIKNARAILAT
jgi:riboflavin kinase/FMN adenylyltransferase